MRCTNIVLTLICNIDLLSLSPHLYHPLSLIAGISYESGLIGSQASQWYSESVSAALYCCHYTVELRGSYQCQRVVPILSPHQHREWAGIVPAEWLVLMEEDYWLPSASSSWRTSSAAALFFLLFSDIESQNKDSSTRRTSATDNQARTTNYWVRMKTRHCSSGV